MEEGNLSRLLIPKQASGNAQTLGFKAVPLFVDLAIAVTVSFRIVRHFPRLNRARKIPLINNSLITIILEVS
jgi:hypothetical protein